MCQHHLLLRDLRDALLDRVSGDESINHDLVGLTDTMGTTERLDVVMGIPIRVIDDDGVGSREIDAFEGREGEKLACCTKSN